MSEFVFQVDATASFDWVGRPDRSWRYDTGGRNNSAFVDEASKAPLHTG